MDATGQDDARALVADSEVPVMVDFFAEWCGPCKMLSPVLESMAPEYEGKMKIIKVDIDASPEFAQENGVVSVPTLVFYKGDRKSVV